MTSGHHRETAKIYQFPARGRLAVDRRREAAKPVLELEAPHDVKIALSGAWYHEAALLEAQPARR